jgi:hypothetical protein
MVILSIVFLSVLPGMFVRRMMTRRQLPRDPVRWLGKRGVVVDAGTDVAHLWILRRQAGDRGGTHAEPDAGRVPDGDVLPT